MSDAIMHTDPGQAYASVADPLEWNFLRKVDGKYLPVGLGSPWPDSNYKEEILNFTLEGIDNVLINSPAFEDSLFRHDGSVPDHIANTRQVFTTVTFFKEPNSGDTCEDWVSAQGQGGQGAGTGPDYWVDDAGHTCQWYGNNPDLCKGDAEDDAEHHTWTDATDGTEYSIDTSYSGISAAEACCACGGGLAVAVEEKHQFAIMRDDATGVPDTSGTYSMRCPDYAPNVSFDQYYSNNSWPQQKSHSCKRASTKIAASAEHEDIGSIPVGAVRLVASTFAGQEPEYIRAQRCADDRLDLCNPVKSAMVSTKNADVKSFKLTVDDGSSYEYLVASHFPYPGNHETIHPYVRPHMVTTGFDHKNYQSCYEAQKVDSCVFDVYVVDTEAPRVECTVTDTYRQYGVCNTPNTSHAFVNITDYFSITTQDNVDGADSKSALPMVVMEHTSYTQNLSKHSFVDSMPVMATLFKFKDNAPTQRESYILNNMVNGEFDPEKKTPEVLAHIGQHTFTFIATDSFENTGETKCEMVVRDCDKPVIDFCGTTYTVNAEPNKCYGHVHGLSANATDNSNIKPLVTMSVGGNHVDDDFKFPIGSTNVCHRPGHEWC